ncbi:MAG: IPTL-CTERM sorting domain-containing protein [Pseudomonadales bacterium]|nr:IPTL-CTERM sorting domain-containing protein [Pseudomonadales bacterium]
MKLARYRREISRGFPVQRILLVSVLALACGAAGAAVVTTPAGVMNGPGSDPFAFDAWLRIDIRATASVGITGDYPRSGNGSVLMTSADSTGQTTWQYFPSNGLAPLGSFVSASYDWYRDASSTTGAGFHPVYRILVDNDGNSATLADQSWLTFEHPAIGPYTAPTNTWVTDTIDGTAFMWVWQAGAANSQIPFTTMAQFASGSYVPEAGGFSIPSTAVIMGVQIGTGSGWWGSFRGAVDSIGLTAAASLGTDNFELAPAPPVTVPATDPWALLGLTTLLSILAAWRQRERQEVPR